MAKEDNNKLAGTHFEKEFAKLMYDKGWWATLLQNSRDGQPSDVIVSKNDISVLVDCKVCEHNKFTFDRIEYNQEYSMSLWKQTGNSYAVFALKLGAEIRIMNFATLMIAKYTHELKQFNYNQIMARSLPLSIWEATVCKSE